MDSSLTFLPIRRRLKRRYRSFFLLVGSVAAGLLFQLRTIPSGAWTPFGLLLHAPVVLIFGIILAALTVWFFVAPRTTVIVDESGVRLARGQSSRVAACPDIIEVRKVNLHRARGSDIPVIRLFREGELEGNPRPFQFQAAPEDAPDELITLIKDGINRFGQSGSESDGSANVRIFARQGEQKKVTLQDFERDPKSALRFLRKTYTKVALIFWAFMLVIILPAIASDALVRLDLSKYGIDSRAQITGHYTQYLRNSTAFHVRFTYAASDGHVLMGDETVSPSDAVNMHNGDTVPIVYDPGNPDIVKLNLDGTARATIHGILERLLASTIILLVMTSIMPIVCIFPYQRARTKILSSPICMRANQA